MFLNVKTIDLKYDIVSSVIALRITFNLKQTNRDFDTFHTRFLFLNLYQVKVKWILLKSNNFKAFINKSLNLLKVTQGQFGKIVSCGTFYHTLFENGDRSSIGLWRFL